ncbi:MAG: DUF6484 domain-containing protein [Pseudomonadales bacterium]
MTVETRERTKKTTQKSTQSKLTDVVVGVLIGVDQEGVPLVVFPGNESSIGIPARATVALTSEDTGCEVALLFENGDPSRPLIIGRIQNPHSLKKKEADPVNVEVDGERIEFNAQKEIVLKCGKASITLTRAGKVLIRGTYLLSRSSGANRIKGGSIQLN